VLGPEETPWVTSAEEAAHASLWLPGVWAAIHAFALAGIAAESLAGGSWRHLTV